MGVWTQEKKAGEAELLTDEEMVLESKLVHVQEGEELLKALSLEHFHGENICGPQGIGKSSLLRALQRLSEKAEGGEGVPVLFLDFSDYQEEGFEGALAYFGAKLSALYWEHLEVMDSVFVSEMEAFLDILEGTASEKDLSGSLRDLVYQLRRGCWRKEYQREDHRRKDSCRPLILIDEISRPVLFGARYGYLQEVEGFLHRLLDIDYYEMTRGILTTSFAPAGTDVSYDFPYIRNVPAADFPLLRRIALTKGIDLEAGKREQGDQRIGYFSSRRYYSRWCNYQSAYDQMDPGEAGRGLCSCGLTKEQKAFIGEKRQWLAEELIRIAEEERRREEESRYQYSLPFPEDCSFPSRFAGVRSCRSMFWRQENNGKGKARGKEKETGKAREKGKEKDTYQERNKLLRRLYEAHGNQIQMEQAYRLMHRIGEERILGRRKEEGKELEKLAGAQGNVSRARFDSNEDWILWELERGGEERESCLSLVKVYLTAREEERAPELYLSAVRFLIRNGKHLFHAKLARKRRLDQMCFWLNREDFFLFEDYVRTREEDLSAPLPFVAYRGKMGIGREMASWRSQNAVQAEMIASYLQTIEDSSEIDLADMIGMFAAGWNGDLPENHPMTKSFKEANVQELLVILESLSVILGGEKMRDDHLLLNGEYELWRMMSDAKNWYELGEYVRGNRRVY